MTAQIKLSVTMLNPDAECHYSECLILFVIMLNIFMPSVVAQIFIRPIAICLIVMAP
jgi:hypothetical protein